MCLLILYFSVNNSSFYYNSINLGADQLYTDLEVDKTGLVNLNYDTLQRPGNDLTGVCICSGVLQLCTCLCFVCLISFNFII